MTWLLNNFFDAAHDGSDTGAKGGKLGNSNATSKNLPVMWCNGYLDAGASGYGYNYSIGAKPPAADDGSDAHVFTVTFSGLLGGSTRPEQIGGGTYIVPQYMLLPVGTLGGGDFGPVANPYITKIFGSLAYPQDIAASFSSVSYASSGSFDPYYDGYSLIGITRFRGTTNPDTDGYWQVAIGMSDFTPGPSAISYWRKRQTAATIDSPVGNYTHQNTVNSGFSPLTDTLANLSVSIN